MSVKVPVLAELNRRAFAILSKEMGIPETLRFFAQLGLGTGNYTEERRQLFANLTIDDYHKSLAEMSAQQEPKD